MQRRRPAVAVSLQRRVRAAAQVVAVACFDDQAPPAVAGLPAELAAALRAATQPGRGRAREPRAKQLQLARGARVVWVDRAGPSRDFDARSRRALAARWVERAHRLGVAHLAMVVPPSAERDDAAAGAAAMLLGCRFASYRFDRFRGEPTPRALARVDLIAGGDALPAPALREAQATADAVDLARDLANTPPNVATPEWIARQARLVAARRRMKVTVLEPAELARRGMGGILAVGQGSAQPARLVRLEWGSAGPKVALVGKGVTFDTGGISIKPAASMEEMKWDKCGACTVLALADAVAALSLPIRLSAYLPLAENMPSATAYRPSDVLRCYNGKTVEIINTDAEGRLLLADALALAVEDRPEVVIDYATLTGACVVALGDGGAGLFARDDAMASALLASAQRTGERLWRLPLWPEFVEQVRGAHGDLKNSAGREGGAATAAAFLSQFVGDHARWAHVDLAGPAYATKPPAGESGATGYAVAFTLDYLRGLGGRGAGGRAR